jgi:hypothetical protein
MKPSSFFENQNATGALLVLAALLGQAPAANVTWKGQTANWNDAANWNPTPLASADFVTFPIAPIPGGTGVTNLNNNSGFTVFSGMAFNPGAGNYTINSSSSVNYGTITNGATQNVNGIAGQRGGVFSIVSNYGGVGTTTVTLGVGTNGNLGDGNVINYVTVGGTQGVGGTNNIVLSGAQTGFLRSRDIYNGADWAYNDAGGFVRAPVYGTDANFSIASGPMDPLNGNIHYLINTDITGQGNFNSAGGTTAFINTIKFSGGIGTHQDLTQDGGTLLQVGSANGGSAGGGILRSGGGSTTISGGSLEMGNGNNMYFRTDSASDTLIINSNITQTIVNNLVKTGAGTLVIGGVDSATGVSWVNEGTLLVNGSHTSGGNYIINPGATLGGTGTISPNATNSVQLNGTLAPGNSLLPTAEQTGILNIGNTITFNLTSSFAVQIGGNLLFNGLGGYDQVNMTNAAGSIVMAAGVPLSLSLVNGYVPVDGDKFFILTRADAGAFILYFAGASEGDSVDLGGGNFGTITYLANSSTGDLFGGNDVAIYLPVPEPSGFVLVALGVAVTFSRLRRRASLARS